MSNYPATNNLANVVVTNPGPLEDSSKLSDALLETRRVLVAVIEKQHDSFGNILPASVTPAMLAQGAVTTNTIVSQAVTAEQIANGSITAAEIAPNVLSDAQMILKGITAASIANNTITETQLAPSSVGTPELINNSVTAAKLATGIDLSSTIANNTLPLVLLKPGTPGSAQILVVDQTLVPPAVTAVSPSGDLSMDHTGNFSLKNAPTSRMPFILASDTKTTGTAGQTLTAGLGAPPPLNQGGWNVRDLNTLFDSGNLLVPPAPISSIPTNGYLLLPAGTYLCDASAPGYVVNVHKAILVAIPVGSAGDPTKWQVLLVGTSAFTYQTADNPVTESRIQGVFTLAAPTMIAILHQVASTGTGGYPSNFTPPAAGVFPEITGMGVNPYLEVYTTLQLLKVA